MVTYRVREVLGDGALRIVSCQLPRRSAGEAHLIDFMRFNNLATLDRIDDKERDALEFITSQRNTSHVRRFIVEREA